MSDGLKPTGDFQAPPPDAPREIAQPLTQELIDSQRALAARFEQPLKPFDPQPMKPAVQLDQEPNAAEQTLAGVAKARSESRIVLTDADAPYRPAESDTDSPKRGIPTPSFDPGKAVTGGWGPAMEAQYYPLDGTELRKLVEDMLERLRDQIQNDLHFSIAMVYPRVEVSLSLQIGGYNEANAYTIQKRAVHDKTSEEVARVVGEPFSEEFSVTRAEFNQDGEPQDPADRMRDSLGLAKPHKQQIEAGGQKMIVDVASIDGSF